MAGVNIGRSEVESGGQGGGATNVFEVADSDAAKAHLDAEGVRQDGDIQHVPGLVRLITFYDPDGNAFMFSQAEKTACGGRRAGLWTKVSPVAFLRRGFPRSRPKTRTQFYSFFRSRRSMNSAGRGDGSRRPKIFGVAGKGSKE